VLEDVFERMKLDLFDAGALFVSFVFFFIFFWGVLVMWKEVENGVVMKRERNGFGIEGRGGVGCGEG
jgi:hypothetical protein